MRPFILPKGNPVHRIHGTQARKGLVFIPDMSGFTTLVRSTDLMAGQIITCELLAVILQHNMLGMEVAEIEGDAVFFYKWEEIPDMEALYAQFEAMKTAFDGKLRELEAQFGLQLDLHLKAIAHYGDMAEFSVGAYNKLYGEVVVEAHRLLKNNVPARSYLLVTDALQPALTGNLPIAGRSSQLCELYGGLRNLCFTYILFECLQPAAQHFC
ncbi:DUF2652 domain-containing protein [Chitinophaga rhizosphaerae]|uniref:DUF2652 domain-containing protein n=1 Tax=Chitinophaga rhizosphaerae TaxID=1864947 RepID=UPI000F80EA41|nr:DUF2652 domain-containing protein [Chitinophaga rhizosphaerae]